MELSQQFASRHYVDINWIDLVFSENKFDAWCYIAQVKSAPLIGNINNT